MYGDQGPGVSFEGKQLDLVGLVTSWVSSNNHSSIYSITSPCGAIINLNLTLTNL